MRAADLRPTQQFSVQIQLIDLAVTVAAVEVLLFARRHADRPGRADVGEHRFQVEVGVVDLDPSVAAVTNVEIAARIGGDGVYRVELVQDQRRACQSPSATYHPLRA